jgi:hypothetical protein
MTMQNSDRHGDHPGADLARNGRLDVTDTDTAMAAELLTSLP